MPPRPRTAFARAKSLVADLPGVEESTSYGTPALKVKGKSFARLREDGETLVVLCGFDERDLRMQSRPDVFFNLPHYYGYPAVLVHLAKVSRRDLKEVLEVAWRRSAPKRVLSAWDADHSGDAESPTSAESDRRSRRTTAARKQAKGTPAL